MTIKEELIIAAIWGKLNPSHKSVSVFRVSLRPGKVKETTIPTGRNERTA
ncbi:hypothetical protein [Desulfosporosinus fructosivorans]